MNFIFILISIIFLSSNLSILEADEVYVMPDQYSYVIAQNSDNKGLLDNWGGWNKWATITLWGRCPRSYYLNKYKYCWVYGDGTSTGWLSINDYNASNPIASSYRYLKSDPHTYNCVANEPISYFNAELLIKSGDTIISKTVLTVKVVNIGKITLENGYEQPAYARRLIVESIAKGRGLLWLYLHQDINCGAWWYNYYDSLNRYRSFPIAGTGITLASFFVHGHSVYDPDGVKDIFVESVNKGINFLFNDAEILASVNSDINNNKTMIKFSSNKYTTWAVWECYEHGIVMLALGASYNFKRANSIVEVGSGAQRRAMYYSDVLRDAVDWAAYAQCDAAAGRWEGGWRYHANQDSQDFSVTQWMVLGLAAIEDVWGQTFKAPSFVREKLLKLIRYSQYQNPWGNDYYDGGACYSCYHNTYAIQYNSKQTFSHSGYSFLNWMTGTSSLLQSMYYLSLDTTTTSTCSCGAWRCDSRNTDFKINRDNLSLTCLRVSHAIDFLAREGLHTDVNDNYFYYLYTVMKALRLYHIERDGINSGYLYLNGNFPPQGKRYRWEDQLSNYLLSNQTSEGWWFDDSIWTTALGVLMLSETIYYPGSIRTDIIEPNKVIKEASSK